MFLSRHVLPIQMSDVRIAFTQNNKYKLFATHFSYTTRFCDLTFGKTNQITFKKLQWQREKEKKKRKTTSIFIEKQRDLILRVMFNANTHFLQNDKRPSVFMKKTQENFGYFGSHSVRACKTNRRIFSVLTKTKRHNKSDDNLWKTIVA